MLPFNEWTCAGCGKGNAQGEVSERESLGLYAGRYCDPCWEKAPYRKEGREGFSEQDAGEAYETEDY